ncbi:MAG: hypothetical protein WBA72_10645 [Ornithinimicrobium sp.]
MCDFEATINSLGEHLSDYIGREDLRQLTVLGREDTGEAEVTVCLRDDTWAAQERAIDKIIAVRELFMDEVALDYHFLGSDSCVEAMDFKRTDFALA